MHVSAVWRDVRRLLLSGVALMLSSTSAAIADPPPWAPGQGYRAEQRLSEAQEARRHDDEDDFVPANAILFPRVDLGVCHREVLGSLVGGGAQRPAIASGSGSGALVGGGLGRAMDRLDHACVGQVLEHAPTGRAVAWRSPDRGAAFRVTAIRTYEAAAGRFCREFRTTATVAGRIQHVYGTACRQPDGAWRTAD
jgi:surface antigen